MKEIEELHRKIDELTAQLAAKSAQLGKPVTCAGKGCSHCCYEPVYCSTAEAMHMLEGLTTEQLFSASIKVSTSTAVARCSGLFEVSLPPVMKWLALDIPCPFLEAGACLVYERRPVGCRYHIACKDPSLCLTDRLSQIYPADVKNSIACGTAIIEAHLKLGDTMLSDNLLAILSGMLVGKPIETASLQKVYLKEEFITREY